VTCENFFSDIRKEFQIDDALDYALHGAELRVDAEGEEHQEEDDCPNIRKRKLVHRFSK
jgi:hypothetical protein